MNNITTMVDTTKIFFSKQKKKMTEINLQINSLKLKLENIKKEIENIKKIKNNKNINDIIKQRSTQQQQQTQFNQTTQQQQQTSKDINGSLESLRNIIHIHSRRILQGHFGKVYSCYWSGDSLHLISASQDGKLILWNGLTTNKIQSIPLTSSWVITCSYEQLNNRLISCGGMDNICSIYQIDRNSSNRIVRVSMVNYNYSINLFI